MLNLSSFHLINIGVDPTFSSPLLQGKSSILVMKYIFFLFMECIDFKLVYVLLCDDLWSLYVPGVKALNIACIICTH